ncbi:hypothetical protein [Desulfospira joergensenii]|uniref:hypothetical protein n=1 Tax=Desulfospira joergensenii TaxID=53329 RepID=UPI00129486D0|nr:hypothetical protein [Desulfospira joergensenii]
MNIDDIIESAYPGSRITEQLEDTWQGLPVTEIELETAEGKDLEVIVSKQGGIFEVEEESSLPLIPANHSSTPPARTNALSDCYGSRLRIRDGSPTLPKIPS